MNFDDIKPLVPEFTSPNMSLLFGCYPNDDVRVPAQVVIGLLSENRLMHTVSILNGSFSEDDLKNSKATMEDVAISRKGLKFDLVENSLRGFLNRVAEVLYTLLDNDFVWIYSLNSSSNLHRLLEQVSTWTTKDLTRVHAMCIDLAGHMITGDIEKNALRDTTKEIKEELDKYGTESDKADIFIIPVLAAFTVYISHVYKTYAIATGYKGEGTK